MLNGARHQAFGIRWQIALVVFLGELAIVISILVVNLAAMTNPEYNNGALFTLELAQCAIITDANFVQPRMIAPQRFGLEFLKVFAHPL